MPQAVTAFHVLILLVAAALFIAAAINDACSYRIPNYISLSLLALFPFFIATAPTPVAWKESALVFVLVSAVGFALFLGRMAGAGDIKLLSVASLWAGSGFLSVLLIVTAFVGGLESLIMGGVIYWKHRGSKKKPVLARIKIPYGIAIATGGLAMLGMMIHTILSPA